METSNKVNTDSEFEVLRDKQLQLAIKHIESALTAIDKFRVNYYDADIEQEIKRLKQQRNRMINVRMRRKFYLNDGMEKDFDYDKMYLYNK